MRAFMLAGVVALVGCGKASPNAVDVICYPAKSDGWNFDCVVTGKGEAKAEEQFSSSYLVKIRDQGNDLNRSQKGARWMSTVVIEQVGTWNGVKKGQEYTFYGTVEGINGSRIRFTDCVFESR